MRVLEGLEPASVFRYFEEICAIPHGSRDTKQISDYCVAFAKEHNLRYRQDGHNNVIIWKDGTKGYETAAPVMLQGHLDMVCEKESGVSIDFEKDGLALQLEDGKISAAGTTLGGDDGIAIAYALAILESDEIPHPPLEVVFTVDEEIGMLGAIALDCSDIQSRVLLNIDSEEEGYLLVSCAGGSTATVCLPVEREEKKGLPATVKIDGLQGGHSGVEIDKGRGNACQLLGRALYLLHRDCEVRIEQVEGGLKDNAIPREAYARVLVDADKADKCAAMIAKLSEQLANEFSVTDSDVKASWICENEAETAAVMTEEATGNVISALVNLPGGIQKMSFSIPGLVQTSLNMGILKTKQDEVVCSLSVRSSVESEKTALQEKIACLAERLGGKVICDGEYPAWEYREDSPLRNLMVEIYEEQYGEKPVVQALHAGLECGIFAGRLPGLDCISFGPNIKDIHTPKEEMDAASVKRTWEYLLEILKRMK